MITERVLLEYQQRLDQIQSAVSTLDGRLALSAALCAAALALFLTLGFLALARRTVPVWTSPIPLPAAWLFARRYSRQQAERFRQTRLRAFYERGVARLTDQWTGQTETGEEFLLPGHLYARDLHLLGPGSLFERLNIARTGVGRAALAHLLQSPSPSVAESLARQSAVRELGPSRNLREDIATLGRDFQQSDPATFHSWLDQPPANLPKYTKLIATALTATTLTALTLAAAGLIPWLALAPILAIQTAFGWAVRPAVMAILESSRSLWADLSLIRDGLALLERQSFQSPLLQSLVHRVSQPRASRQLHRLHLLLHTNNERTKEWFWAPSLILLTGTHLAIALETWRAANAVALRDWLDAWGQFEAFHSLGCYAHESPEDAYPEFVTGAPTFTAEALAHPLLPRSTAVPNGIALNDLLIVSGSNMAGKSTFLRAIGVNSVLAAIGAPVRAKRLQTSLFSLGASLNIQDALLDGKSRFLAEVERLRAILQLASAAPPVLFLIDEIFSGTNSEDRRIAAEAVLNALRQANAVGAVSTHDLALTAIPGRNMHMCARDAAHPLDFDYLLKPGINTQTNALAIARMAGVPA